MNVQTRSQQQKKCGLAASGMIALVGAAALVAGCTPSETNARTTPSPAASSAKAAAKAAVHLIGVGETFRNGAFEVKVTRVRVGLPVFTFAAGMAPTKSMNGQLVVVGMTAKNVGTAPTAFRTEQDMIVDGRSRAFAPEEVRGFDYHAPINPEAHTSGSLVFDVPADVTVRQIVVQTDDSASGAKRSTLVTVRPENLIRPDVARTATPRATRPSTAATPGASVTPRSSITHGSSVTPGASTTPGASAKPRTSTKPGTGAASATPKASVKPGTSTRQGAAATSGAASAPPGTRAPAALAPAAGLAPAPNASGAPPGTATVSPATSSTATNNTATNNPTTVNPATVSPTTATTPAVTTPRRVVFFGFRLR